MATKQESKTVDFDARRKKKSPTVRANLKAFGKTWKLIRPNGMIAGDLVEAGGDINPQYVNAYLLAHVHPDQRAEFARAATEDAALDLEGLMELMSMMTEAVYEGVPSARS